jgi:hypothetical protein
MVASPLWKYFFQDKTYYKSDKTHKNAWCLGCLDARKRVMIELDASKVREGLMFGVRNQEELNKAGKFKIVTTRTKYDTNSLV